MNEQNERQTLIEYIYNSVDLILGNAHMSEEEKVRVFQEALLLIDDNDHDEAVK